jgi:hypothetical protein
MESDFKEDDTLIQSAGTAFTGLEFHEKAVRPSANSRTASAYFRIDARLFLLDGCLMFMSGGAQSLLSLRDCTLVAISIRAEKNPKHIMEAAA